jgi:hypothetical protein
MKTQKIMTTKINWERKNSDLTFPSSSLLSHFTNSRPRLPFLPLNVTSCFRGTVRGQSGHLPIMAMGSGRLKRSLTSIASVAALRPRRRRGERGCRGGCNGRNGRGGWLQCGSEMALSCTSWEVWVPCCEVDKMWVMC